MSQIPYFSDPRCAKPFVMVHLSHLNTTIFPSPDVSSKFPLLWRLAQLTDYLSAVQITKRVLITTASCRKPKHFQEEYLMHKIYNCMDSDLQTYRLP